MPTQAEVEVGGSFWGDLMETVDKGKNAISAIKKIPPALRAVKKATHQYKSKKGLVGGIAPAVYFTNEGEAIPNRTLDTPDEINEVNTLDPDVNYNERDMLYDVFNNIYDDWYAAYRHNHSRSDANALALEEINRFVGTYSNISHSNTALILPDGYIPHHDTFHYEPIPFVDLVDGGNPDPNPNNVNVVGNEIHANTNPNAMEVSDDEMEGAGRNYISPHTVLPFFAMN